MHDGYINGYYIKPFEKKVKKHSIIRDFENVVLVIIFLSGCYQIADWIVWWANAIAE